MPYTKRYKSRSRRRTRSRRSYRRPYGPPLTRRPRMTWRRRVNNNLTRDLKWFKTSYSIPSNQNGNFYVNYAPGDLDDCADFNNWAKLWEEYKVLQLTVDFHVAAVGSESLQEADDPQPYTGNIATFKRGNVVTWIDQGSPDPTIGSIPDIMVRPSCRMINARRFHKRKVFRPMGNPNWGQLDEDGSIALGDEWNDTRVKIYGEGFTPQTAAGTQIWYYVVVKFKVIFRGRQQHHP